MKDTQEAGDIAVQRAWLLALAFGIFRFWYAGRIQLSPDEAYYWEWSRSLDLSYYDQGPMLALAIRLGTLLFGVTELGVRCVSVASGVAVSWLAIGFCKRELKRPVAALWLVLALNTMLLFGVGAVLMMHDSLMTLFWMLALVCAFRALQKPFWWMATGICVGLAMLSKYTGVLFFGGLGLALLTHPGLRRQARSPWLWAGLTAGLALGALPVWIWNQQHGWPSFQHIFSLAGGDSSRRSLLSLPEFLSSQFALVTPLLFWLVARAWWKFRGQWTETRWLLWCLGAGPFLLFCVLSLRTRVEGNWPAEAYLAGLLLVAADLDLRSKIARGSLVLAMALSALVYVQAARPFLPLSQGQAKLDSASRVDGWRELGARVEARRAALGPQAFVACRTYQIAAELAFYSPGHLRPLILQKGPINHQYRFWNDPEAMQGQDAVLVTGQEWEIDEMSGHFSDVKELERVETRRNQVRTQDFRLLSARAFKP
ncbi:MAG: glycosyltransferase family 39 protein [candidate division FCPU426 bacterium]